MDCRSCARTALATSARVWDDSRHLGTVNASSIQGITILDSPTTNIFGGDSVYGVKLLSPWYWSTDGFQGGVNTVDQSFAFVGDNVFFPIWAGSNNNNVTITNSFAG